jgi:hypothetical protein
MQWDSLWISHATWEPAFCMGTKLLKKKIIAKKIDKTFGRHEHILTYIHGA